MIRCDVAVLGAGPAGCIAALQLGRAELDVVLIDPFKLPDDHLIESFPVSGAQLAEEIGILETICGLSEGPASSINMLWRDVSERRTFGPSGPLLIRKQQLAIGLRSIASKYVKSLRATARGSVICESGTVVSTSADDVHAKMIIDARGRRQTGESVHGLVAIPFSAQTDAKTDPQMHVEAHEGAWVWACRLADTTLSGNFFVDPSTAAGMSRESRREMVADYSRDCAFPVLQDIQVHRPVFCGLSAAKDPVPELSMILIGDAALARDPIASHGLIHAMRSGVHAAVATQTILDPDFDSLAARCFLRIKHQEAVSAARAATAKAYQDQSRYKTDFWRRRSSLVPITNLPKILEGQVELAAPLTQAPMIDGNRIKWAPALKMPANSGFATQFGPISAAEIAAACKSGATLQDIAERLANQHSTSIAFPVVEELLKGGALVQARRSA